MNSSITPTPSSLPIIDIAPYLGHKPQDAAKRALTAAALHAACLEFGFFYLDISTYVDHSEPEELTALAREFFALPQEEKNRLSLINEDHARGTVRFPLCHLN
jgi:isopenicillin N synthase-like dioxygenase